MKPPAGIHRRGLEHVHSAEPYKTYTQTMEQQGPEVGPGGERRSGPDPKCTRTKSVQRGPEDGPSLGLS